MNIIKTVGDLKKALLAYEDNLPLDITADGFSLKLATDMQIAKVFNDPLNDNKAVLAIRLMT